MIKMVSRLIPSNKLKWSTSQTPFFWSHARNESCTTTLKLLVTSSSKSCSHYHHKNKWNITCKHLVGTPAQLWGMMLHWKILSDVALKSYYIFFFFFLQWCCPGEWPLATILSLHPATFAPWRHHLIFSLFLTPTCSSHLLSNILCLILLLKCLLM